MFFGHYYYTPLIAPGAIPSLCKNRVLGAIKGVYIVTLIQHTIYTPLIAPGAIPSLCKNHVFGAIKGVYRVTLIQHTIYTPLIAPSAIHSLCKNRVLGAIKGTNGRQKTYEIVHVYCFYSGFMCQTIVIFGITKD